MTHVVTIPAINTSFFVADVPGESLPPLKGQPGWEIEEGAWIEVVPNLGEWPQGTEAPQTTLCRSLSNPQHYKVFNRPADADPTEFRATGMNFGGPYSRRGWDRFTREGLVALLKFYEIPDTDPPGAMDEAMRLIREARLIKV